jgi:hypothetical protein
MVDVAGIDRKKLLKALWDNAKPAAFFKDYPSLTPTFDLDDVMRNARRGYVDYACGRCIKAKVFTKESTIDPRMYDREYGEGAFQRVVDSLIKN